MPSRIALSHKCVGSTGLYPLISPRVRYSLDDKSRIVGLSFAIRLSFVLSLVYVSRKRETDKDWEEKEEIKRTEPIELARLRWRNK